jgi:hypothetical protein
MNSPVEPYGEMELLRLLDQFFDRALCFATAGYEQYTQLWDDYETRARETQKCSPVVWFVANGKTDTAATYSTAREYRFAVPCASPPHRLPRSIYLIST